MRKSLPLLLGALVLCAVSVILLKSFSLAQPVRPRAVAATYTHGVLHISIPDDGPRAGDGTLTEEILDPEDGVIVRTERHAYTSAGRGLWRQDLALPKTLAFDDLVWHRLRYRFTYNGGQTAAVQGLTSISRILRLPTVHVFGQQTYLTGGAAAVRLIVTEQDNETPVTNGSVEIQLSGAAQKPQILYTGKLNERGTTQAHFRFPAGLPGSYSLRYALDTALGPAEYTQQIRVEDKASILLTTEKPVYQPRPNYPRASVGA